MAVDLYTILVDWFTSTFTGENTLNNLASLFTVGIIAIAPIIFIVKQRLHKRTERQETSKSLHEELRDALESLDGTKGRQVMKIKIGNVDKYYTLTFMNYDMYDSLIFSGQIQSINHDLQQKIQDIFRRIKGHQEYLKYTSQLRDNAKLNDKDMDETTTPYYSLIADYESELEELIPPIMKELEKNF